MSKEVRIHNEKKKVSLISGAGKTCKWVKLEHSLTPYTKINSKWIKNINVRPDTIRLLGEKIGRTVFDINHSEIFSDPLPRVLKIKTKINGT